MRTTLAVLPLFVFIVLVAAVAVGQPPGTSIGSPRAGFLLGGIELPTAGPGFRFETNRDNPEAHFGTAALVGSVLSAISKVNEQAPGSELVVEDLSLRHGGMLQGHGSHTSGRDVDLRFYAVGGDGRPVARRNVVFDGGGRAVDGGEERFDVERNWLLLEGLLTSRDARVQHVFIHSDLEALLLQQARRRGASRSVVRDAALRMKPPGTRNASPHDDHMHVRIYCPATDRRHGCRDHN